MSISDKMMGLVPRRQESEEITRWATVTQVSPLRIRLDGEAAPLLFAPVNMAGPLAVSDRVRVSMPTNGNQAFAARRTIVTDRAGGQALVIPNDTVTNAMMANVPTQTFKGRNTAGTGDPEDMSLATARGLIQQPAYAFVQFTPAGAISTGSTSYSNITNAVCTITKRHGTGSHLLVRAEGTWFFSASTSGGYLALRVNGTDYLIASHPQTVPVGERVAFAGSNKVTGLAAGDYTVQLRWKSQSASLVQMNADDDIVCITAMEVWP